MNELTEESQEEKQAILNIVACGFGVCALATGCHREGCCH